MSTYKTITATTSVATSDVIFINRKASNLKKERDDGYIEYKLKLINIERQKLIKLISQMNYRLNEGDGKSIYAIGFSDDGSATGITKSELDDTLENIFFAANELKAEINKILIFEEKTNYWAKIFLFKDIPNNFYGFL